jgi:hypothetical protein
MKIKTVLLFTMFVAAGSLLSAQGLKVEPGTCIKVETGTTLDISGGGNLFLESDATGDASLIDLGTVSYTGGGEAKVERYLTNGKWHLISAPVVGTEAGMFEEDYLQLHIESTNAYTDVTSMTYGLIPAKGYALWTVDASPTTELFIGTTNTGNQSFNFTKTDLPNDDDEGWNLVGNPYPSVIDWDEVTKPTNLSAAIWLFDPTVGENGDYKYYINGGAENTTTQYIPSGQGFFVRAVGGNGTLQFANDDRTHSGQSFYKSRNNWQVLVLKATGNDITTQTAIRFIPESTSLIDRDYDVYRIISGSPDVPFVYSKCENQKMAINSFPQVAGHDIVPVYFESGTDGTYSFTATNMETLGEEVPVFLEDINQHYIQDLRANPDYSFHYDAGTVKAFNIHFKDATNIDEFAQEATLFQSQLSNGRLSVHYLGTNPLEGNVTISVYNLAGQCILEKESMQAHTEISLQGSSAMYIVHIRYNQAVYATKVFNR